MDFKRPVVNTAGFARPGVSVKAPPFSHCSTKVTNILKAMGMAVFQENFRVPEI